MEQENYELTNLELFEVSFVGKGDDPLAKVTFTKSAEEGKTKEPEMDKEELETLKSEVEKLKSENERLRKKLIEDDYVIKADVIEKKAPVEYIEYEGEKINKADVPAPILKALEVAEKERADAALEKRATETLPHFNKDVAKDLLAVIEKSDKVDALMQALEAADKAFEGKMEELGGANADGEFDTATDKMEALVKAHMEEHGMKKSEYAVAYATVSKTDQGREVLKAIRKGE